MADNLIRPGKALTAEQIETISGGVCTVQDLIDVTDQLKQTYETLVEFASHVIERNLGGPGTAP